MAGERREGNRHRPPLGAGAGYPCRRRPGPPGRSGGCAVPRQAPGPGAHGPGRPPLARLASRLAHCMAGPGEGGYRRAAPSPLTGGGGEARREAVPGPRRGEGTGSRRRRRCSPPPASFPAEGGAALLLLGGGGRPPTRRTEPAGEEPASSAPRRARGPFAGVCCRLPPSTPGPAAPLGAMALAAAGEGGRCASLHPGAVRAARGSAPPPSPRRPGLSPSLLPGAGPPSRPGAAPSPHTSHSVHVGRHVCALRPPPPPAAAASAGPGWARRERHPRPPRPTLAPTLRHPSPPGLRTQRRASRGRRRHRRLGRFRSRPAGKGLNNRPPPLPSLPPSPPAHRPRAGRRQGARPQVGRPEAGPDVCRGRWGVRGAPPARRAQSEGRPPFPNARHVLRAPAAVSQNSGARRCLEVSGRLLLPSPLRPPLGFGVFLGGCPLYAPAPLCALQPRALSSSPPAFPPRKLLVITQRKFPRTSAPVGRPIALAALRRALGAGRSRGGGAQPASGNGASRPEGLRAAHPSGEAPLLATGSRRHLPQDKDAPSSSSRSQEALQEMLSNHRMRGTLQKHQY